MSEDFGKLASLEGELIYPRKHSLKEIAESFTYVKARVVLENGDSVSVPIKAKWVERRYGKFKLIPDRSNFKKVKEAYIEIEI